MDWYFLYEVVSFVLFYGGIGFAIMYFADKAGALC